MFKNFFKKKNNKNDNKVLIVALLIHAAKIDENYTEIEKKIITKAIMDLNKINFEESKKILHLAEKIDLKLIKIFKLKE